MKFERQVFISYAHLDNQPLSADQLGWVSLFHQTLQTMLSQRLGAAVDIWRDAKLRGDDVFSDEILAQLAGTALFVSVLTPRYLKSDWCTREISAFCAQAEAGRTLVLDNKARLIKVIKLPLDSEGSLPAVAGRLLGYEFFEFDDERTPRELDPAYGDRARQAFLRKVNKLAWDLAAQLERLQAPLPAGAERADAVAAQAPGGLARPAVFLAECSRDRRDARERIEAELACCGYAVLPQERLPDDEAEHLTAVDALLARCMLSVHLVGQGHGRVPDGPRQQSVVMLQNERAAQRSRSAGLRRVLWLAEPVSGEGPAQQQFVAELRRDAALQFGADLVSGDLETLKAAIHAALAGSAGAAARAYGGHTAWQAGPPPRPAPEPPAPAQGIGDRPPATPAAAAMAAAPRVLLLCDARDRRELLPLIRLLRGRGLEVALPVFSGDAAAVRQANRELFLDCDAVLLIYAAGDEAWKYHQQAELRKLQASPRTRPLKGRWVVLAPPLSDDKELLQALAEPDTLDALDGLAAVDAALLGPLWAALQGAAGV